MPDAAHQAHVVAFHQVAGHHAVAVRCGRCSHRTLVCLPCSLRDQREVADVSAVQLMHTAKMSIALLIGPCSAQGPAARVYPRIRLREIDRSAVGQSRTRYRVCSHVRLCRSMLPHGCP